jgi:hypothetical protein
MYVHGSSGVVGSLVDGPFASLPFCVGVCGARSTACVLRYAYGPFWLKPQLLDDGYGVENYDTHLIYVFQGFAFRLGLECVPSDGRPGS